MTGQDSYKPSLGLVVSPEGETSTWNQLGEVTLATSYNGVERNILMDDR
ncbi:MAG: hypothetical protein FWC84_02935 [Alphaproteobacteria bacterium]|nr:hypothetical protein [Alphaproteobacteria bacterium]